MHVPDTMASEEPARRSRRYAQCSGKPMLNSWNVTRRPLELLWFHAPARTPCDKAGGKNSKACSHRFQRHTPTCPLATNLNGSQKNLRLAGWCASEGRECSFSDISSNLFHTWTDVMDGRLELPGRYAELMRPVDATGRWQHSSACYGGTRA